jgi:hypothetical protein
MTESKLAAELEKRGWQLVAYPDQEKKPGARFRALRPANGAEAFALTTERLLERIDLYDDELERRGLAGHRATVGVTHSNAPRPAVTKVQVAPAGEGETVAA